ncbi:MAG: flagellar basal body-associated FliL family protein [Desulfotomaculales bacterium]
MPTKKTKENQENSSKGKRKPRLILILALCLVLGGGLAYGALRFFHVLPSGDGGNAGQKARVEATEKLDLGNKVVNLGNGESGRYLRVQVVLEYPAQKKLSEEVKSKQPLITEKVLNVFRSKKAEEIMPVEKLEKVKEEILKAINEDLQQGKVTQVYFTDFLVQ